MVRAHLVKVDLRRTGHVTARVDSHVHLLPKGGVRGRVRPLLLGWCSCNAND